MSDVLLIQPPILDFYLTAKRTIPQGLASIGACLIKKGFSVTLFDALASKKSRAIQLPPELSCLEKYYGQADISPFCLFHGFKHHGYSHEHMGRIIREEQAKVVGISSLFTAYSQEAMDAARLVKKYSPESFVVMGGHHPTAFPERVMACDAVDFVIRGEGEESFPALVRAIADQKPIPDIPGLVFRNSGGKIHVGAPAWVKNPESLPIPDSSLTNRGFYGRKDGTTAVIVASRGCPMKCSYCCLANSEIPYRRRSLHAVMAEMETAVVKHNARFIDFEDENLSLDKKWFTRLLSMIPARFKQNPPELRAMNGLFPPSLDPELVGLMKAAGFKTLNLSIGSTHPERLEKFNRPDVTQNMEIIIEAAQKHGLQVVCYIIAGAPGQHWEESLEDLLVLARLPVLAGLSIYYPAPGSLDFKNARAKGTLPKHFSMMRSAALPTAGPMTPEQAVTLLRLARMVNFMKSLIDSRIPIPKPSPCKTLRPNDIQDRSRIGQTLLSWFFHDGHIRGASPDTMEIYKHVISTDVTKRFINNLRLDQVRGTRP